MEKSIEKTWIEAFENENLNAKKITDFYNLKSSSIIDKIKATYTKDNKSLIPIGVFAGLLASYFVNIPLGIFVATSIVLLFFYNKKLLKQLEDIDIKSNTLSYLKNYQGGIKKVSKQSVKMLIVALPLFILICFTLYSNTHPEILAIFQKLSTLKLVLLLLFLIFTTTVLGYVSYYISYTLLYKSHIYHVNTIIKDIEYLS